MIRISAICMLHDWNWKEAAGLEMGIGRDAWAFRRNGLARK